MVMKMNKQIITSIALGSAVAFTSMGVSAASAENPFSAVKLSSGYQLAEADDKMKEGKCGEGKSSDGKCGGDKSMHGAADKKADGKCGGEKCCDGNCGGAKHMDDASKKTDGKCGEGKCGGKP